MSEHTITVTATRIHEGAVSPATADHLIQEGTPEEVYRKEGCGHGEDVPMDMIDEVKRTYVCSCGEKFRRASTAREHLLLFREDSDD